MPFSIIVTLSLPFIRRGVAESKSHVPGPWFPAMAYERDTAAIMAALLQAQQKAGK